MSSGKSFVMTSSSENTSKIVKSPRNPRVLQASVKKNSVQTKSVMSHCHQMFDARGFYDPWLDLFLHISDLR